MIIPFKRVLAIMVVLFSCLYASATIRVVQLQMQSLTNPLGIETATPDFSWQWQTDRRGSLKIAYQVAGSFFQRKAVSGSGGCMEHRQSKQR